ncbi:MAG: alpha/beta fold hydrolase [Acidobacteria bacterium]|nr:alpha/beta fold hydrolase [Acidobacteriota bacterium]MBV9070641.1 alpha/beta fold hydrolase [Acidobacteriota bacterium]MBV9478172.1 alpha/beta fold hydrolase [Acidobacteriota bacterium]
MIEHLSYDSEGDGPLVVLLHGFPESRITWRPQLAALARAGFRAVAPDLRGYGDSPTPKGVEAYTLQEIAGDVAALIESLGAPCILVGHDWGAVTAWVLTMMRPELVRKLVILNIPHPASLRRVMKKSFRQKVRLLYQLFFQLPLLPELTLRLIGRAFLRRAARFTPEEIEARIAAWHLTPMLNYYRAMRKSRGAIGKSMQPIRVPTLLIWSTREPVFLPETFEGSRAFVENLTLERIDGIGHFVQHDAAERVNELLLAFARA